MTHDEKIERLMVLVQVMHMGLEHGNSLHVSITANGPTFGDAVREALNLLKSMGAK